MKHQYENSERTVNLRDWLMEFLVKWRVVLWWGVAGCLLGVLLCAYKWYKPGYEIVQTETVQEATIQEAEQANETGELEELTENDVEVVDIFIEVEKLYKQHLEYNKESSLMQIDSTKLPLVELQFFIDYERTNSLKDDATAIKAYYTKKLESEEYFTYLLNHVSEIKNNKYYWEFLDGSKSFWKKTSSDKAILSYSVCANDLETAKKIADETTNYLISKNEEAKLVLGEHQISLMNTTAMICNSFDLLTYQKEKIETQSAWYTKYDTLKKSLSKQQTYFYEFVKEGMDYEAAKAATNAKIEEKNNEQTAENAENVEMVMLPRKINIIWLFLGMASGVLAAVAYISLGYLLTGKVRYQDELNDMYGIPKVANILMPIETAKWSDKIDHFIYSKMTKRYGLCKIENGMGMVVAKTLALLKNKESKKIIVLMGDETTVKKEFFSRLEKEFAKRKMELKVADEYTMADVVLEETTEHPVLLVLEHNKDYFYQVEQKLELCNLLDCTVEGAIVLIS